MNLVLIGKADGWKDAPPCGKGHDTWGVNDLICRRPVDVIFGMHYREAIEESGKLLEWSNAISESEKSDTPMYVPGPRHYFPDTAIVYPLREVVEEFGSHYFYSSVDYMLALAMLKGYDVIDMYGISMSHKSEYSTQKASAEFWIGMALGRGVEVNIHGRTHLCRTVDRKLYGYEQKYEDIV